MKQPEAAVSAFRNAQELRPDIRSYQGATLRGKNHTVYTTLPFILLLLFCVYQCNVTVKKWISLSKTLELSNG